MTPFIPCSAKRLPDYDQIAAAATAIMLCPSNRPPRELDGVFPPARLAVMTTKYWGSGGVVLTVGFMEQIPNDLASRLIAHANAWSDYCNVKFARTMTDPQVRITRSGDGYWSFLGTDILHIPKNQPTMCLQDFTMNTSEAEFHRVVRHEFGHVLGFPHEHMRKELVARIDRAKAIAYFAQTQGWSEEEVDQQVLQAIPDSEISLRTPNADQQSIMCYQLPGSITIDGQPIIGGDDIDLTDQQFVAKVYPKPVIITPPTPPPPIVVPPSPPVVNPPNIGAIIAQIIQAILAWLSKLQLQQGAIMSQEIFNDCANELEAAIAPAKAKAQTPEGAQHAPTLLGVLPIVTALIASLRAGDLPGIMKNLRDLLTLLLGDTSPAPTMAAAGLFSKVDWAKLVAIITKLLPLILGA